MSQSTVLDPVITVATAYQVITPTTLFVHSAVREPALSIGTEQTITPPPVT